MKSVEINAKKVNFKKIFATVSSFALVLGLCGNSFVFANESVNAEDTKEIISEDVANEDMYAKLATSGDIVTGDIVTGDIVTGDIVTGDIVTGDIVTGDIVTGDIVTGDIVTGDIIAKDAMQVVSPNANNATISVSEIQKNKNANGLSVTFRGNKNITYDKVAFDLIKKVSKGASAIQIEFKQVDEGTVQNVSNQDVLALYSLVLNVVGKDGSVQSIHNFNGGVANVTVGLANPNNLELQVYRVEGNGSLTAMTTFYNGGVLSWLTDGHSYYMVREKPEKKDPIVPNKPSVPEKPILSNKEEPVKKSDSKKAVSTAHETLSTFWKTLMSASFVVMAGVVANKNLIKNKIY